MEMFLGILICLLFWGCATTNSPKGYLPTVSKLPTEVYGGWIQVDLKNNSELQAISGELVAVETDSLFILNEKQLYSVSWDQVSKAKLTIFDSKYYNLVPWTVFGTISTISHGFYLVLSAPVWILTGTIATVYQSKVPQIEYPKKPKTLFNKYARFPQGIPHNFDRKTLKPKPV